MTDAAHPPPDHDYDWFDDPISARASFAWVPVLSIQFDNNQAHEYWVSGRAFERLFLSALEHGHLPSTLEDWRHVADANGGLSHLEPEVARELLTGLRAAALAEVERLCDAPPETDDWGYRIEFEKFLAVTNDIRFTS